MNVLLGTGLILGLSSGLVLADVGALAGAPSGETPVEVAPPGSDGRSATPTAAGPTARRVLTSYARLPLSFEPNRGQADPAVKFLARGRGYTLFLTSTEAILAVTEGDGSGSRRGRADGDGAAPHRPRTGSLGRMQLLGGNPEPRVVALGELPAKVNYFLGKDPARWRTAIPTYRQVRYEGVYPGIDLVYYGRGGALEYDFVVAPGADPAAIRLGFAGADRLEVEPTGHLVAHVGRRRLVLEAPVVTQTIDGVRRRVSGRYVLQGPDRVGFHVGDYDRTAALVIDPVLVFSTYLGGAGIENGNGIAVDAAGNAYVAGTTAASNFPVSESGPLQGQFAGVTDAFVTKFDATGALLFSTFLGGNDNDDGVGIGVDGDGNVYVAGTTVSPDFPTANAFQPALKAGGVFKSTNGGSRWAVLDLIKHSVTALAVDPVTTATVYAGTIGGLFKSTDRGATWSATGLTTAINAVAVDPLAPSTLYALTSSGLVQSTDGGAQWAPITIGTGLTFVSVLAIDPTMPATLYAATSGGVFKSTNRGLTWSVTGLTSASVNTLVVDPAAPARVYAGTGDGEIFRSTDGGATWSGPSLLPTVTALVIDPVTASTLYAGSFGAVFKSTDRGSTWTASTGGLTNTLVTALIVDPVTPATVYAGTTGGVFKSTDGGQSWSASSSGLTNTFVRAVALDPAAPATLYVGTNAGAGDAFVAKLSATGSALLYSTYLGGGEDDIASGIAVDAAGDAYVTGYTGSGDFPTTAGVLQPAKAGIRDVFVARLNPAVAGQPSLVYATYLSGGQDNLAFAIAVDGSSQAHVTGRTSSPDFPITAGAYQRTCGTDGTCDGGEADVFVTKLNALGSAALYSTYLGASGFEQGGGVAVDAAGKIYVTGDTFSPDFPTVNAFQSVRRGARAAFVAVLDPGLNGAGSLVYSTYLGGTGTIHFGNGIAVDAAGNAYVIGDTNSTDFPVASAIRSTLDPGLCSDDCPDAFVAMLNPAASGAASLVFSTFLGGSGNECCGAIAVDPTGSMYVVGWTDSTDFPTTPGAFQPSHGDAPVTGFRPDAFVARISGRGLSVAKAAAPDPVMLGGTLTYTLTVSNIGADAATGVTVTDTLPPSVVFVSATPSQGTCTGTAVVSCALGTIPGNGTATVTISATPGAPGGVTNTASVTGTATDPNPGDNTVSVVTTVKSTADLGVTMTASGDPIPVGSNLVYTMVVTNHGPDPVASVTLTDRYPVFALLASPPSATQGTCVLASGPRNEFTCELGALARGASATVTVVVTPTFQAVGTITNAATVSGSPLVDPNAANDTASVSTRVRRSVSDLAISVTDIPDPALLRGSLSYLIDVSNNGPDAAGDVLMVDHLAVEMSLLAATPSQGTCSGTATVSCDLGTIGAGSSVRITLEVTPLVVGRFGNTAGVLTTALGSDPDPVLANNSVSIDTTVRRAVSDLRLTMVVPTLGSVGNTLTYTIAATNLGPDQAGRVSVTDTLPAGVTFVSATPSQGACTGTTTVTCDVGPINAFSAATVTLVVTPTAPGRLTNTARVSGVVDDPDPTNDTVSRTTEVVLTAETFGQWVTTHCPPFVPGIVLPRVMNVAFLPVKYPGAAAPLPIEQVVAQTNYIRDYFFQQSMCSVTVNPFVVRDPSSADGWLTLPGPLASYNPPPPTNTDPAAQLPALVAMWIDAFQAASVAQPAFLVGQLARLFDAIVVLEPEPRDVLRGRAFITKQIANHPLVVPIVDALRAGIIGAINLTPLGPLALLFNPGLLLDLLAGPELLEQGSVIIGAREPTSIWIHELGHALFTFWDYYGTNDHPFVRGGILASPPQDWGLMAGAENVPPPPVITYNKQIAGWLGYRDIAPDAFGDYPLTALKDLPFGSQALRYRTRRNLIGHPLGPTAWYIFELRRPPDDVPIAPEQVGQNGNTPGLGQTGVVIYDKREVQRVLGVATHHPFCGALHGFLQSTIDTLLGHEFGSCLWKVDNVQAPGLNAPRRFSLRPGESFSDSIANVTFTLTEGLVLRITGTEKSAAVVRMESQVNLPPDASPTIVGGLGRRLEVDLHLYTPDGRHVGPNYATGEYEVGIAGAKPAGVHTPEQWISLPDDVDVSYVIDASPAAAAAQAAGLSRLDVTAVVSVLRYDANGAMGKLTDPVRFTLDFSQPTSGRVAVPLGAGLGAVQDLAPPVVTPPADVTVPATEAGGARVDASPALGTFLTGGSAVDDIDPFPAPLAPEISGAEVTRSTLVPLGTTAVTFRFADASGKVGAAVSHVTVSLGQPRLSGKVLAKGVHRPGLLFVDLQLTNTGTGNARTVSLNQLLFRTLAGSGTVTYNSSLSPSLPRALGNLDAGSSTTVRLFLDVPPTVTRFSIVENGTMQNVAGTSLGFSIAQAVIP